MSKFTNILITTALAVAVLPIGAARAALGLEDVLVCRNVSTDPGIPEAGVCGPDINPILEYGVPRFTWVTSPAVIPVADLFDVSFQPSSIILTFTADAAGRFDTADENVLLLGEINPVPDKYVRIKSVDYNGTWNSRPSEGPTINNTGRPNNEAQIRWDLGGAVPSAGDTAEIFLSFFEPGDLNSKIGVYKGSKTTLTISPAGCPNAKEKNVESQIGFGYLDEPLGVDLVLPFAGCWAFTGVRSSGEVEFLGGLYIERKVGKDLTMSLGAESLIDGVIDEINDYLLSEPKCDYSLLGGDLDVSDFLVKKGNGKLSKKGDRIKLDLQVEGKYTNDSGKTKNVKAKIKGKMDFEALAENPASDCGLIFID